MTPKRKMLISGISLLVAIILMTGTSLAWFTLSTKPETTGLKLTLSTGRTLLLSTDINKEEKDRYYFYTLNLSEAFEELASLHPVSTADGIHWYIPTYNSATGSINPPEEFILDTLEADSTLSKYGNVSLKGLTGRDRQSKDDTGYYVYTDFLIKTEDKNGCEVYLSIPKVIDEDELDGYYGSYVLPSYALDKDGNAVSISNKAETAVRVGFLISEYDEETEETTTRFVIYEPNADARSIKTKKPTESDTYISGYTIDGNYKDGMYLPTKAITFKEVWDYDKIQYMEEGDAPAPKDGETYQYCYEAEYVHVSYSEDTPAELLPYYTYSDEDGYQIYTGDYTEVNPPDLYRKNYVAQERYFHDSNMHYLKRVYSVYDGIYADEVVKPILYVKTSDGDENNPPTYERMTSYHAGAQYYVANYYPVNFSYYSEYVGDYTETDKPRLYTKDGTGYHLVDPTAQDFISPGGENAPTYYVEDIHFTTDPYEDGEEVDDLYAFGYVDTARNDDGNNIVRVTTEVMKSTAEAKVPEEVIVQKSGSYNLTKVKDELTQAKGQNRDAVYDSTMVGVFGKFLETPEGATNISDPNLACEYASDTLILTLEYNVPVKIRLCIWIEGQDVDCWNDITSGTFNINLELAGYNSKN